MKTKILLYMHGIQGGGAEKFFLTLANGLNPEIFDVHVVLGSEDIKDYQVQWSKTCKVHYLKSKASKKSIFKLAKLIRLIKPSIAFTTINKNNIILLLSSILSLNKMRIVIREANHLSKTSYSNSFTKILTKWLYNLKATNIVAVSKGVKEDLIKEFKIKPSKVTVIYSPIDLEKTISLGKPNPYKENKLHRIIHVGSFTSQKDHNTLIEAVALVKQKLDVHLTLVGDGPLKKDIVKWIEEKELINNVTFTGFVQNPYPYINHSDIFVLSSIFEGFPNVLLEAMALKTPVISTDCPSGPSELIASLKNGILVPMQDALKLSEEIYRILINKNESKKLTENAFETVQSFSVDFKLMEYQNLFLN